MSQPQPETPICGECAINGAVNCSEHGTTREDLSATPRCDEIAFQAGSTVIGQWVINKGRAKEIELENNQLRVKCATACVLLEHLASQMFTTAADEARMFLSSTEPPAILKELEKDKTRLDWLEKQTNGHNWIARESITNRGFRLHNDERSIYKNAREAIDAAMKQTT